MKLQNFFLIALFLFCMLISCKKNNNVKVNDIIKFGWAKNGKKLYYDQYKGSNIVKDYLKLTISDNRFFQNDVASSDYMDIVDKGFVIKKEGLFGLACVDCSMGLFSCYNTFEFLYAPNAPSHTQEIHQYSCGRDSYYNIQIIKIDTIVSVSFGTFNTYVMLHENGDKSYWNADNGIILYERMDYRDRTTLAETYKLNRVE